jgi:putative CocE/NonD family hydrolase
LPDWPPAPAGELSWYLQADGRLDVDPPATDRELRYDYDPADPTPGVGGAMLGRLAGPADNRALEARPDVLVFTSAALPDDVEIAGQPSVRLWFGSSLEHTDVFVRLCDVHPDGRSENLSDILLRLRPGDGRVRGEDGEWELDVELSAIAARIAGGHQVRLQVSSGAFPRFSRNTGSGEPDGSATTLSVAHQRVALGPQRPAVLRLPLLGAT